MYFAIINQCLLPMKYINYLLVILGAVVAIYAKSGVGQNQYVLIGGVVILMIGIYRIARNIPSRDEENQDGRTKKGEDEF